MPFREEMLLCQADHTCMPLQLAEGDASAAKRQAAEERQDSDFSPGEEASDIPSNYDGPATRTRATSDTPTDVPDLPRDV